MNLTSRFSASNTTLSVYPIAGGLNLRTCPLSPMSKNTIWRTKKLKTFPSPSGGKGGREGREEEGKGGEEKGEWRGGKGGREGRGRKGPS